MDREHHMLLYATKKFEATGKLSSLNELYRYMSRLSRWPWWRKALFRIKYGWW